MAESHPKSIRSLAEKHKTADKIFGSEKLYKTLIERSFEAVTLSDDRGNYTYATPAVERILGYTPEEFTHLNGFTIVHPDDAELLAERFKALLRPNAVATATFRFQHKAGNWVWIEATATNLLHDPTIQAIVSNFRDVTERKQAEEDLQKNKEQFQKLADYIPNLAWMANADGWIYWYNSRWYEYTGTSAKDMEGWGWQSVHDPQELPRVLKTWKASIQSGKRFDMVFPLKGADGIFRPFLTRVVPIKDDNGVITNWFGTNTDISRQKEAERSQAALSEQLIETLESMSDAFFTLDKDWKIIRVNSVQEKVSHTKRKDTVGKVFWDVFPATADPASKYWIEYHKVRKTGKSSHFVEHYAPLDIWTEADAYPTREGGISVFFRDITERKHSEEALQRSEERLRFMAESLPQKIFTADPDGKVDYFNSQWVEYTGVPMEKLHADGVQHFVHPDDLPGNMRSWRRALKTGEPIQNEQRLLRADGQYRRHISHVRAMRDESGKIVRWFGSMTDIDDIVRTTARKNELEKVTTALRKQHEELLVLNQAKDEFISLASHQLRTPATGVKQYVGMLLEGYADEPTENQRRFLQQAYESNERQLKIVNDLLKVASVDAGKVKLNLTDVDLVPMIDGVIAEQAAKFEAKNQTVSFKHPAGEALVYADSDLLRMVLENLIDNAGKYTYPDKAITIRVSRKGGRTEVGIKDQGVGINKEDMQKLFQKFTRLENPLSVKVGGTGLGLYWVKKVIDLLGGSIHVRSQESVGTEFTIELPAPAK